MSHPTVPFAEILFTAKTGFLSRNLWKKHFTKRSKNRNYEFWNELVERKFFKRHRSPLLKDILILGTEGIRVLENKGLGRVFPPNINQIDHDEVVSDLALQLQKSPKVLKYETEGEIKRRFTGWVKDSWKGENFKFSDLMVYLKNSDAIFKVAIEVELSRKSPKRYKQMMRGYQNQKQMNCIVFVADDKAIFDRLRDAIKHTLFPTHEKPIGFCKLQDLQKNPLNAPIHFSEGKISFEKIPDFLKK